MRGESGVRVRNREGLITIEGDDLKDGARDYLFLGSRLRHKSIRLNEEFQECLECMID